MTKPVLNCTAKIQFDELQKYGNGYPQKQKCMTKLVIGNVKSQEIKNEGLLGSTIIHLESETTRSSINFIYILKAGTCLC